ncbi:MAG: ABC transporter permease [Alphaproteobacteria bacterium]|nr:ABC transporter permease [Alphaproteobacteria bacterium]MCB9694539.1 ABC transporter permease [Alphaproteobacteria bacterium]
MIRRILVVAEREVRETVLRRAFLMVLLTPLGMLVMVLALAVALPALVTWLGPSVEPASVLEVCPPSLVEPVRAGLPEWRIETCGAVERSTLDARVTLDDDGRVHVQVRHRDDTVALVRAVDHAVLAEQLHEAGVDPTALEQASREVVAEGWREDRAELAELRGAILGTGVSVLLFLALLIAGQQVLMATLEEKGNRVIEILLGAVGPGELFVGKLAGQLVVALVFAASWGIPALLLVPLVGLWIGPVTVLEIALFLIVDLVGWMALTAGVGSLLSDLGEARQAVGRAMPLMLALVFVGWGVASFPELPMSRALGVLPPTCAFAMPVLLVSNAPPPQWQVALAMSSTLAMAAITVWFGRALFRLGLLLRSRPPDLRTLLRWLRSS